MIGLLITGAVLIGVGWSAWRLGLAQGARDGDGEGLYWHCPNCSVSARVATYGEFEAIWEDHDRLGTCVMTWSAP